ncbi:MAG: RidA family protein [Candidatus Aminicenantes bacterium]|nr:RidA family protein [Candidatus Aminicenantes bacterium]
MNKQAIATNKAPGAVGPYSQGIRTGNFIFLSGQIGMDPATSKLVEGGVEAQTRQIFKNIEAVLGEAGAGLGNIVKAAVFLKDMADFKKVNEIYAGYFDKPYPARSAVAVRELPLSVDIEIEVIAAV